MPELHTIGLLYSPVLYTGGVETHILSLLRHGDATRYRWLIIAATSPTFERQAVALGAEIVPWKPTHAFDFSALIRLKRLLQTYPVNLLHAHSPLAALYGRVVARLLGLPAIVTVHLPLYYFVHGRQWQARVRRWLYRNVERLLNHSLTDQLIYVSPRVGQEAVDLGLAPRRRSVVIGNGIDLTPYADTSPAARRHALAVPLDTTVVCCVARLERQKGIDVLLEAIHLLKPPRSLRVWLVGDGAQRSLLEAQANQFGLGPVIEFMGYRTDVPCLLLASDVFVLPSRYEAMPMAILEAMAAGLPCIVTDVGENAQLIKHNVTGLVVPAEAPEALAVAIRTLLTDSALRRRLGQAARQSAQAYSAAGMVSRTLAVYDRML